MSAKHCILSTSNGPGRLKCRTPSIAAIRCPTGGPADGISPAPSLMVPPRATRATSFRASRSATSIPSPQRHHITIFARFQSSPTFSTPSRSIISCTHALAAITGDAHHTTDTDGDRDMDGAPPVFDSVLRTLAPIRSMSSRMDATNDRPSPLTPTASLIFCMSWYTSSRV